MLDATLETSFFKRRPDGTILGAEEEEGDDLEGAPSQFLSVGQDVLHFAPFLNHMFHALYPLLHIFGQGKFLCYLCRGVVFKILHFIEVGQFYEGSSNLQIGALV